MRMVFVVVILWVGVGRYDITAGWGEAQGEHRKVVEKREAGFAE